MAFGKILLANQSSLSRRGISLDAAISATAWKREPGNGKQCNKPIVATNI